MKKVAAVLLSIVDLQSQENFFVDSLAMKCSLVELWKLIDMNLKTQWRMLGKDMLMSWLIC